MRSKAHDELLLLGRAAASAGCGRVPLQRLHFDRTLTKARDARRRDAPPSKIAAGEKPRFSSNYEPSVFVTAYNSRSPIRRASLLNSANHSDSSGLARSLALSFSRVAAARRIPVLPHVLQRNSGFLARARHARGNDRKIRPSGRACHYGLCRTQ